MILRNCQIHNLATLISTFLSSLIGVGVNFLSLKMYKKQMEH